MKVRKKPLVIKKIHYAAGDDANRRKISQVLRLLLDATPAKEVSERKT